MLLRSHNHWSTVWMTIVNQRSPLLPTVIPMLIQLHINYKLLLSLLHCQAPWNSLFYSLHASPDASNIQSISPAFLQKSHGHPKYKSDSSTKISVSKWIRLVWTTEEYRRIETTVYKFWRSKIRRVRNWCNILKNEQRNMEK